MKRFVLLFALSLALGLAYCDSGDSDDDGGGGGGGGADMCGGKCISGQYCWNGICANGCLSNGDCAADQYCAEDDFFPEGKCVAKVVPGCASDADCASTQVCKNKTCVVKPAENAPACAWKPDMTDGCSELEVCIEEMDEAGNDLPGECYAMPACGEDGSCPTDMGGATCNVKTDSKKIIPSKSRICLMGLCLSKDDCPSEWDCQKVQGDIGVCFPGGFGDGGCETDDDCDAGESCTMNMCVPGGGGDGGCETDDDCDMGEICVDGFCEFDMGF